MGGCAGVKKEQDKPAGDLQTLNKEPNSTQPSNPIDKPANESPQAVNQDDPTKEQKAAKEREQVKNDNVDKADANGREKEDQKNTPRQKAIRQTTKIKSAIEDDLDMPNEIGMVSNVVRRNK